jgi:hypothetical protein
MTRDPEAASSAASGFQQQAPATLTPAKRLKFYPGNQPTQRAGTSNGSGFLLGHSASGLMNPK